LDLVIKKQKDFDAVFGKGKRVYTKTLTLLFIKGEKFRFGISLSKKHGKATVRNRIKRLIRAAVREIGVDTNKKYNVVILPKVFEKYDFFEIKKDLTYALIKGELINV
jgi:ribonuclease P protein component